MPIKAKPSQRQKLKRAGIIASTGLAAWLAVKPIPKERIRGHEREPGVALVSYRHDFKGSLGQFFNPKPIKGNQFQNWVVKNKWKEWNQFVKKIVGDARYRLLIKNFPKADTWWLTEEQALALNRKLAEYQKLWGQEINKGVKLTPQGYKSALYHAGVDTTGLVVKPSPFDSTKFDTTRTQNRKRRKNFINRRIRRRDSRR